MKIAITGASGLIGQALVENWNRQGHEVVQLVRHEREASDPLHCWWDPERGVRQLEKLESVPVLVHLAGRSIGQQRWTKREKKLIYQSRVDATQRLCASLGQLSKPLELLIGASAVGIYGDCGDEVVTEDKEKNHRLEAYATDEHRLEAYATMSGTEFLIEVARQWEAVTQGIREFRTPVVSTRFGVVLSPDGGALAKMLPLFRWGLGSNLGSGRQYWSWIALEDVVRAIDWIIARRSQYRDTAVYNLTSPQPVTNAEFTRVLAKRLGRFRFLPVPEFALRLGLGEMADAALLCSCRAVPEKLTREGFEFKWPELDKALAALPI